MRALVVFVMACGSSSAMPATDGSTDTPADARMQDPDDPVEAVPAFTGAYSFGKLTTDDFQSASSGTWFNDDTTEHQVSSVRTHFARYRDGMVLQSKTAGQLYVYDQATTMAGAAIAMPSDAVGRATVRGGLLYVGGLAKVYAYELATQTWRSRDVPGAGSCHHVAAGATRLFVVCAATAANTDALFTTWANKTMSDVVALGTVSPGSGAEFSWVTAAPGGDIAYFASSTPDQGCIGKATIDHLESCVFSLRTLLSATVFVSGAQIAEDGTTLYVDAFGSSGSDHDLYEVPVATPQAKSIGHLDSYATCPDGAVVFQYGTLSSRRAGGVTSAVRLGSGGQADMGCPLKKL